MGFLNEKKKYIIICVLIIVGMALVGIATDLIYRGIQAKKDRADHIVDVVNDDVQEESTGEFSTDVLNESSSSMPSQVDSSDTSQSDSDESTEKWDPQISEKGIDIGRRVSEILEIDLDYARKIVRALADVGSHELAFVDEINVDPDNGNRTILIRDVLAWTYYVYTNAEGKLYQITDLDGNILYPMSEKPTADNGSSDDETPEEEVLKKIMSTEDKTVTDLRPKKSSIDDPLSIGEWGITGVWISASRFQPVCIRPTKITRGDATDAFMKEQALNDTYGVNIQKIDPKLEYVVIEFDLYLPQDAIRDINFVRMYVTDLEGKFFPSNYGLDDMCEVHLAAMQDLNPGEQTHVYAWYTMEKDKDSYLIKIGDSNLNDDEFVWVKISNDLFSDVFSDVFDSIESEDDEDSGMNESSSNSKESTKESSKKNR